MNRARRVFAIVIVTLLASQGVAIAAWLATGTGTGGTQADSIPKASAPTATVGGRNVTVTWPEVKFADGKGVSGYSVVRYGADGSAQTIKTNCLGTITGLTCTERAVPPGSWTYAVTALQPAWTGPESDKSTAVTVGSPAMSITSGSPVTSLPGTLSGSISNFITGQTVSFKLDSQDGQTLSGSISPSPVPENGSATFNVTIPSGTSNGSHTLFAIGSEGDVASAAFTVATGPRPTALRTTNAGGAVGDGLAQNGDTVVVTYSQQMSVKSFCSTWDGDSSAQSITANGVVTVTIHDNAAESGNDLLRVGVSSAQCGGTFRFGSVDLGSNEFVINGNVAFRGTTGGTRSSIAWDASNRTLTLTLGSAQTGGSAGVPTAERDLVTARYFPDPEIKSSSNQSITGTADSPNEAQF